MTDYRLLTITLPDRSKIWRMVPIGWSPKGGYSPRDNSHKHGLVKRDTWLDDLESAEETGITRKYDKDAPPVIDTDLLVIIKEAPKIIIVAPLKDEKRRSNALNSCG